MTTIKAVEHETMAAIPLTSGAPFTGGRPIATTDFAEAATNGARHANGVTVPQLDGASKAAVMLQQSGEPTFPGADFHVLPTAEQQQYPWSCVGRVEASPPGDSQFYNAGTGTLVDAKMVLIASHMLKDRQFSKGWRFRFVPGYRQGAQPNDPTGTHHTRANFTGRIITGDPSGHIRDGFLTGKVYGWDFAICELDDRLGDFWGHLGVIAGGKSFYRDRKWYSIGYPTMVRGQQLFGEFPIRFPGIDIDDVENQDHNSKEIETEDYTLENFIDLALGDRGLVGWSGGPLLGIHNGTWWVGGALSGQDGDDVLDLDGVQVFAGGQRLLDIHQQANKEWYPSRAVVPGWATVAAVSRSTDKLDLFVTDVDGKIRTAWWEPAFADGWRGWNQINGGLAGAGAPLHAVARSKDKLDIFVVAQGTIFSAAWEPANTTGWHGWWEINGGKSPGGRITAVARGKDKLDVFVAGSDGQIYTAAWDPAVGNDWRGWWRVGDVKVPHGGYITAVSRSTDKIDLFVVDVNGKIRSAAWEPSFTDGWHGWWEINGGMAAPGAPVTAVSRSKDKIDIFVVGTDSRVWSAAWEPSATSQWFGWWPIGDVRLPGWAAVNVVSRSKDKLDLFVTDVNGVIRTAAWEPTFTDGWRGWWEISGGRAMPGAPVSAVSRNKDVIDIFVVGTDGRVWSAGWAGGTAADWHGWWLIGA